ncbi:MAG: amino acid ABC transporter ATP-binding protein [Spirochaetales bacterium]|nr:amino acid ABC transporter ATP-binding protein [Spirochaetales bacterium]
MMEINNLCKSFGTLEVLKNINLTIEKGDVIAVIGPSGSGKTTLLRCMNFLEKSDKGTMTFDGTLYDLNSITKKNIFAIRKKTGFVFQNYNLFRNKTVLQNVTEGLKVAYKMKKTDAEKTGIKLLEKVGMSDKLNSYPHQLSGGQQQRVAIARALSANPEIIYFDEPTSALDPELTGEVLAVMKNLAQEGMTMIVVTHEMNFARNVSTKTVFMENGEIIEMNSSRELFDNPKKQRTKEFINSLTHEN